MDPWAWLETTDYISKFGNLPDIDNTDANEDVWDGTDAYTFPTTASTTTITSTVAADAVSGTGAETVHIFGLDADYMLQDEAVSLTGTNTATAANTYLRIYRAFVETAGSNDGNVGDLSIEIGGTEAAKILAGVGQTLMAIYTIPADYDHGRLLSWYAGVSSRVDSLATVALQVRPFGGAWQTKRLAGAVTDGTPWQQSLDFPDKFEAKTDIRIRVEGVSANSSAVFGGFDILLRRSDRP